MTRVSNSNKEERCKKKRQVCRVCRKKIWRCELKKKKTKIAKEAKENKREGYQKTTDAPTNEQESLQQAEIGLDDDEGLKKDEAYEDPAEIKPRVEEELELPDDLNLDGG